MTSESWKTFFEIGGVILLFLTFLFGAGALFFSTRINAQQTAQLRDFDKQLTEAKTGLLVQQERAAKAEKDLLNLQDALGKERAKTLQLQRSVTQRMIPQVAVGSHGNWDVLRPFKGITAVVSYYPQREPENFYGSFGASLLNAGWIIKNPGGSPDSKIPDGVQIIAHEGKPGETDLSFKAAETLSSFLRTYGIEGVTVFKQKQVPQNTVLIQIGQMPDPSQILK